MSHFSGLILLHHCITFLVIKSATCVHRVRRFFLAFISILTRPHGQKPKHQHKPPAPKAPGVRPRQWPFSCVYFPSVTSTCVANALSLQDAGARGGGGGLVKRGSVVLGAFVRRRGREWAAVSFERFHFLSRNNKGPVFDYSHPLYQGLQRESQFCFVSTKTVTQHNCWYVLREMMHCCSCKQLARFSAACIYSSDPPTAAGEDSRVKFT